VSYCRSKAAVVAVNDAYRLAPWADVLYSSDRFWWSHYRGHPAFAGQKAAIEHTPGRHLPRYDTWGVQVYRNTGMDGIETDPTGLRTCGGNSGGAAVNLAVHLGARRIVLLGYDMGYGASSRRHFFGDHPQPLSNTHNFPTWRMAFRTMRQPLESLGIEVVNCSRVTALDAFPCAPLEAVLC
jgi:hypothetical protein